MQPHNLESADVAIFWDYENCHASFQVSGYEIVSGIRNVAHRFGSVKHFKAYMEVPDPDTFRSLSLRSELQSSGVSLTDCPHNGRKNVADQMIMVDILAYAMDHPPPATLILISGDRDFAYAVSILRLRRYEVVVISLMAHISLKSQASVCLDWNIDVLGYSSSSPNFESRADSPTVVRSSPNVGHTRKASYLGDRGNSFSAPNVESSPEVKIAHPSSSVPAKESALEHPSGYPGLPEQPECVPAPTYFSPSGNIVGAAIAPGQLTSNPLNSCCSPTVDSGQLLASPTVLCSEEPMSAPILLSTENPVSIQPLASPIPPDRVANSNEQALKPDRPPTPITQSSTAPAENPSQKKIPPGFRPLVDVLDRHRAKGIVRPLRSTVGSELVDVAETLYKETGANNFSHLIALAEQKKIVYLGGSDGNAWISFHRDWTQSPEKKPSQKKKIPPTLQPLVDVLEKHREKGVIRPLRSTVGFELVGLAKTVYKQTGTKNFGQLAALAEKEKIVELGGRDGKDWISLSSDFST